MLFRLIKLACLQVLTGECANSSHLIVEIGLRALHDLLAITLEHRQDELLDEQSGHLRRNILQAFNLLLIHWPCLETLGVVLSAVV